MEVRALSQHSHAGVGYHYSVEGAVLSLQCEVWSLTYWVHSVHCAVRTVQTETWSMKGEWWSVQCKVCSVQCAVCSVHCWVYSMNFSVWPMQCAVCSVQCAMFSMQGAIKLPLSLHTAHHDTCPPKWNPTAHCQCLCHCLEATLTNPKYSVEQMWIAV